MTIGPTEDEVRFFYNTAKETWPTNDPWHIYTHNYLTQKVQQYLKVFSAGTLILNAGAGDTRYESPATFYDVDIAEEKLINSSHPIVANIESLPFEDNYFDCVICVGSVLNYCDLYSSLSELIRVLAHKGSLLIEYERSQSAEFLFTHRYNSTIFPATYHYNGQNHKLWLYSDAYVINFLQQQHIQISQIDYFHGISSLISRFTKNEPQAAQLAAYDHKVPWLLKYTAHNCIIWGSKL